jgi:hypothetical protein
MMNWLYSLPDAVILLLSIVMASSVMAILPLLVRRLPNFNANEQTTDFALRLQGTLFTMTSLLLAFTLVQAQANFRIADGLVAAEGSQINRLDRLLTQYGDKAAVTLRAELRAYASSIVDDEWPRMLRGEDSEKTRHALAPLSEGVFSLEPSPGRQATIYAEILRTFDSVAESRDTRLNTVSLSLPSTYWYVVLFAAFMLVLVTSTIERTPFRIAIVTAQMAVIGAFMGFAFIMDQPFRGQYATDSRPIAHAIALIDSHGH